MTEPHSATDLALDAHAVRVLAHPLRSRLLTDLRVHGPATATDLAARLNTNTGATSYHLRALAEVGLVEDTGDGAGRRREWRAATTTHSWANSDFTDDPDARAALGWLSRDYVRQSAEHAQRWLDAQDDWPTEWVDALGHSDSILTLTPAQALALRAELAEVFARFRDAGADEPGAVRILAVTELSPVDPVAGPAGAKTPDAPATP